MKTANEGKILQANAEKFLTYIERDKRGISCLKLHHKNNKILIPLCSQEKVKVTAGRGERVLNMIKTVILSL